MNDQRGNRDEPHLSDEEIIRAVVDEGDLKEVSRLHLSSCGICRREKENFEGLLAGLGARAEVLFEPPPLRPGLLTRGVQKRNFMGGWAWRGLCAAAVSVCLIFALLWQVGKDPGVPEWNAVQWSDDILGDEKLNIEVVRLVENALPEIYLDISGESDEDIGDELMNFVVPETWNENLDFKLSKEVHYVA